MTLTLYSFHYSGNSYKPRLLAALLGIPLQIKEVSTLTGQQKTPEVLAINPRGTVPFLVDESKNVTLLDSAAILTYLASMRGTFWSTDPLEQARIIDWLIFAATRQVPMARSRLIWSFLIPRKGHNPEFQKQLDEFKQPAYDSLDLLEQHLQDRVWVAAERPTIADVALFAYASVAPMGNISLDKYTSIRAWINRVKELPGYLEWPGVDDPLFLRREAGL